ncbi:beta-glucuronosyltransferase GlcAT14A-like, partial [Setaria viridis]|uniref:beta-glucuronosyltransferase GlcAT14A-like n=1 Tax=Setaria viridis TaxID=4556 RepID=UPI003B3A47E8
FSCLIYFLRLLLPAFASAGAAVPSLVRVLHLGVLRAAGRAARLLAALLPHVRLLRLRRRGAAIPDLVRVLHLGVLGDAGLLAALYHPANSYLLHLDREAPAGEHRWLAELVSGRGVYATVGNVWIVGRPNLVTYRGPTVLTTTLHAVVLLLRLRRHWDWFVNLSTSDYPLVT